MRIAQSNDEAVGGVAARAYVKVVVLRCQRCHSQGQTEEAPAGTAAGDPFELVGGDRGNKGGRLERCHPG